MIEMKRKTIPFIRRPRATNDWSGPPHLRTPPLPRQPCSTRRYTQMSQSEQGSGCEGQHDHAETTAKYERQQSANMETNGRHA